MTKAMKPYAETGRKEPVKAKRGNQSNRSPFAKAEGRTEVLESSSPSKEKVPIASRDLAGEIEMLKKQMFILQVEHEKVQTCRDHRLEMAQKHQLLQAQLYPLRYQRNLFGGDPLGISPPDTVSILSGLLGGLGFP